MDPDDIFSVTKLYTRVLLPRKHKKLYLFLMPGKRLANRRLQTVGDNSVEKIRVDLRDRKSRA